MIVVIKGGKFLLAQHLRNCWLWREKLIPFTDGFELNSSAIGSGETPGLIPNPEVKPVTVTCSVKP